MAGKGVGAYMRRPPGAPEGVSGELSERVAGAYENKEIAGKLETNMKTVETYKRRSHEELGLRSRADRVRYASLRGWLRGL